MSKEIEELEKLAKRLYVARAEQRVIDCGVYGADCYSPTSLEECRIELGLGAPDQAEGEA